MPVFKCSSPSSSRRYRSSKHEHRYEKRCKAGERNDQRDNYPEISDSFSDPSRSGYRNSIDPEFKIYSTHTQNQLRMKTNEAESGSWIFREEPRVQILTCFAVLSFRSADTGVWKVKSSAVVSVSYYQSHTHVTS